MNISERSENRAFDRHRQHLLNSSKHVSGRCGYIPFIALIRRCGQILCSLFFGHLLPYLVPAGIAGSIVELRENDEDDVVGYQSKENGVAGPVEGFVVVAIDLPFMKFRISISGEGLDASGDLRAYSRKLTLEEIIFEVCTHILYNAEPTVRVLTEPALRLVIATAAISL